MPKLNLYIETTVVSYLVSRESKNKILAGRQESTRLFWSDMEEKYNIYISDLVIQEARKGDSVQAKLREDAISTFPLLAADVIAKQITYDLLHKKAIPEQFPEDAAHIAIAAANRIDIIVTWNFSHINNPFTKMMIRQVIENEGLKAPEICSPEELLGDEI